MRPGEDLFAFWAEAKNKNFMVHPADETVLNKYAERFKFPLDTLVGPFMGPARNAPITLLYANGGRTDQDIDKNTVDRYLAVYENHLSGGSPLPLFEDHWPARHWTEEKIRAFGMSYDEARAKIAFLNIVPYKTQNMNDWSRKAVRELIEELPSVQVMRRWLHDVLLPEAIAGKRMVVCLRSAALWRLESGKAPEGGLFTPALNRRGFLPRADRPAVWKFMRERLGIDPMQHTVRHMERRGVQPASHNHLANHVPTPAFDVEKRNASAVSMAPKSAHDAAWRKFREGRLGGEGARRLSNAVITGVFPERQRVHAAWRRELFGLYRRGQRVADFVDTGMAHRFVDKKGFQQVRTREQMLDHVCWDVSGRFITIDEGGVGSPAPKSAHDAAWRKFREGRLDGEGARRLSNAVITGVFPERQRVHAAWRRELFGLYRKGQRVCDFVKVGMEHKFVDKKGLDQVATQRVMLDHVCWDVSGGFITINEA